MVNIKKGGNSATLSERIFTTTINFLQATIVNSRVRMLSKGYLQRPGLQVSEKFILQLKEELGITPERLWWGPMTLFPHKAQFLTNQIVKYPPKRLLEVGSGTSSALFAALAVKYNFKMLSLDNYKGTMNYVQSILEGIPCEDKMTLQLCNFIRRKYPNGEKYWWYDAILDGDQELFDFIFIDGPMSTLVGRNGALPEIVPYLAKDHRIFIDDYNRPHEKDSVSEWKRHYPALTVDTFEECKGIACLHLPDL